MSEIRSMACCGLREYNGVSEHDNSIEALEDLISCEIENTSIGADWCDDTFKTGAILFTQAGRGRYGHHLADLIETLKLGTVEVTEPFKNLNTGNSITLFIWTFDRKAVKKWWDALPVDPSR